MYYSQDNIEGAYKWVSSKPQFQKNESTRIKHTGESQE